MDWFAGNRQPLHALLQISRNLKPCVKQLSPQYNMCLQVNTSQIDLLLKYAYLEHLLRVCTPQDQFSVEVSRLPSALRTLLIQCREASSEGNFRSFLQLAQQVLPQHLEQLGAPHAHSIIHRITSGELSTEVREPSGPWRAPIVAVLTIEEYSFLLYTPLMNCLDGFDPITAEPREDLIPQLLMTKARQTLYVNWDVPMPAVFDDVQFISDLTVSSESVNEVSDREDDESRQPSQESKPEEQHAEGSFASIDSFEQSTNNREEQFDKLLSELRRIQHPAWKHTESALAQERNLYCGQACELL